MEGSDQTAPGHSDRDDVPETGAEGAERRSWWLRWFGDG
jgi:hypothetical protein